MVVIGYDIPLMIYILPMSVAGSNEFAHQFEPILLERIPDLEGVSPEAPPFTFDLDGCHGNL